MSSTETINKALGVLISGLQAEIGTEATVAVLDAIRVQMVATGEAPTDEQLRALTDKIKARSENIQGA